MIRSYLVKSLYDNLLGPTDGNQHEEIEQPYLKYELGILNSSYSIDSHNSAEDIMDSDIRSDAADITAEMLQTGSKKIARSELKNVANSDIYRQEIDTDINFKLGTVSLGLHFVLKGQNPRFRICATWARYTPHDQKKGLFKRHPNFFVTECLAAPINESLELDDSNGGITHSGARLYIRSKKVTNSDSQIIRVFLVNKTKYEGVQKEEHRIFQPQIRVISDKSDLMDLDSNVDGVREPESDDLIYRNRRPKARGYMCAAVWNEVDPENHDEIIGKMSWCDGKSVPEEDRKKFTRPLVRTEYLPLYTVLQPDDSRTAKFDALKLSEAWEPGALASMLGSIVDQYSKWIHDQRDSLSKMSLGGGLERIGNENLKQCEETCSRIQNGIDFIQGDERARAAFCFMNAVMNDNYRNQHNTNLSWREFQMAFILQSLRGVSGKSEMEREQADVLWFPTGGGKTEAYLGIVVFAIAYRRLSEQNRAKPDTENRRSDETRSNDGGVCVISRYTLRLLTIQQFLRALGVMVAADVKRVENWLPESLRNGTVKLADPHLIKTHEKGSLWGNHRFSIGLWIGGDATPSDFAYRKVRHGKTLLNAEGTLLPTTHDV